MRNVNKMQKFMEKFAKNLKKGAFRGGKTQNFSFTVEQLRLKLKNASPNVKELLLP